MSVFLDHYAKAVSYRAERFNPVLIAESERAKLLLVCLDRGQFIPVHSPKVDLVLIVLEGEGTMTAGDRDERLQAGTMVFVPAGERRGIRAETRLVAAHLVTPPPTKADHAEVIAKLQEGICH